jgi:copper resistance protein D
VGNPVPALNVLVTVLSDSSYAVIVGSLLATSWIEGVAVSEHASVRVPNFEARLARVGTMSVAVLVVCHLMRPWFVASTMSGSTHFGEAFALIPTILSSTRQGGLWAANSVALAMLLTARLVPGKRSPVIALCIQMAALGVLAATKAASSHASEEGDVTLAEICQFVHLLATAVWAGAIIVSGLVVVPRFVAAGTTPALWNYGKRLSQFVTWALGVLVLSGLYVSWRDVHGTASALWTSSWGKILLTKGAFAGLAALLGSLTRFRCLGCPATSERAALMTNLLRSEAAVMAAILCISGLLANTNPGA